MLPCFSFNVRDEEPSQSAAGVSMPNPAMHHVTAGCEVTLPKLTELVLAPLASKTSEWYQGHIGREVEARVLAGAGDEWTERTSGDGRKMRSRGKKRDRPKAVAQHETTWVACDACGKWRKLPPGVQLEAEQAASKWRCKNNVWDPQRQSCAAPEEPWT